MKARKIAFILSCLGLALMITSIYGIYTAESNNEVSMGVVAFTLTAILSLLAIVDYDYLSKKEQL
jgi:hypothetical protein